MVLWSPGLYAPYAGLQTLCCCGLPLSLVMAWCFTPHFVSRRFPLFPFVGFYCCHTSNHTPLLPPSPATHCAANLCLDPHPDFLLLAISLFVLCLLISCIPFLRPLLPSVLYGLCWLLLNLRVSSIFVIGARCCTFGWGRFTDSLRRLIASSEFFSSTPFLLCRAVANLFLAKRLL